MSSRLALSLLFACIVASALLSACGEPEELDNQNQNQEECTSLPVCDIGDQQVSTCPDGVTCYERTVCDETITCVMDEACDLPTGCPAGWSEVQTCDGVAEDCETFETCDGSILCAEDGDECTDTPSCPADSTEVPTCPADASCEEVTVCDETIVCQHDEETCIEEPECPAEYTEVDQCPADTTCVEIEDCDGDVLICEPKETCTGLPECSGDDPEVDECPEGATCETVEVCEVEILCMTEGPTVCGDYGCPDGFSAATPCEGEDECFLMSGCDDDVLCGGASAPDPCDAEAACPAGWGVFEDCETHLDVCALSAVCDSTLECAPQELIDAYHDPCSTDCPDGFSPVATYAECTEDLENHCLDINACGTEVVCQSDQPVDCDFPFVVCPIGYLVDDECTPEDNTCILSVVCGDAAFCALED